VRHPNGTARPTDPAGCVGPSGLARLGEAPAPTPPPWYSVRVGGQLRGLLVLGKSFDLNHCIDVAIKHAPALILEHDQRDWSAVVYKSNV